LILITFQSLFFIDSYYFLPAFRLCLHPSTLHPQVPVSSGHFTNWHSTTADSISILAYRQRLSGVKWTLYKLAHLKIVIKINIISLQGGCRSLSSSGLPHPSLCLTIV